MLCFSRIPGLTQFKTNFYQNFQYQADECGNRAQIPQTFHQILIVLNMLKPSEAVLMIRPGICECQCNSLMSV